jgi:chromosome segregation ATPase
MVSTYGYMGVGALAGFIIGCAVVGAIALATDNKLQKARETNSSQKQRLEGLKTEKARNIATLSYQVERIRLQEIQIRKIEPLERDVRLLQAEVAEQGKRVGQLQNSIETITAERDRLQNSIETLTADRDRLRNSVETLTANRDRLQSSVENITIERDQLHQSTVEARATITQLEPFETEASELRSQVRELEGLLRSRKRKLEEMAIRLQEAEEKRERLLSRFDFVNQKMIEQTEVASEMKLRLRKSLSEIESLKGNRDEGGQ